jgi:hypothetical protein
MSKGLFRGTFRASIAAKKGVQMLLLARDINGKYSAENALEALPQWIEAAKKAKVPLCKWSFYIPEYNQKVAGETIPVEAVEKALKDGLVPYMGVGYYGSPKVSFISPVTTTKVKSNRIDL